MHDDDGCEMIVRDNVHAVESSVLEDGLTVKMGVAQLSTVSVARINNMCDVT